MARFAQTQERVIEEEVSIAVVFNDMMHLDSNRDHIIYDAVLT